MDFDKDSRNMENTGETKMHKMLALIIASLAAAGIGASAQTDPNFHQPDPAMRLMTVLDGLKLSNAQWAKIDELRGICSQIDPSRRKRRTI